MRGFKEHDAADRFCREHDELRNFPPQPISRRRHFLHLARIVIGIMQIA